MKLNVHNDTCSVHSDKMRDLVGLHVHRLSKKYSCSDVRLLCTSILKPTSYHYGHGWFVTHSTLRVAPINTIREHYRPKYKWLIQIVNRNCFMAYQKWHSFRLITLCDLQSRVNICKHFKYTMLFHCAPSVSSPLLRVFWLRYLWVSGPAQPPQVWRTWSPKRPVRRQTVCSDLCSLISLKYAVVTPSPVHCKKYPYIHG